MTRSPNHDPVWVEDSDFTSSTDYRYLAVESNIRFPSVSLDFLVMNYVLWTIGESLSFIKPFYQFNKVLGMVCKGLCVSYAAKKPTGSGRYASGQKRCQVCGIFILWNGLTCPCCGLRLRLKPRASIHKTKLKLLMKQTGIALLE